MRRARRGGDRDRDVDAAAYRLAGIETPTRWTDDAGRATSAALPELRRSFHADPAADHPFIEARWPSEDETSDETSDATSDATSDDGGALARALEIADELAWRDAGLEPPDGWAVRCDRRAAIVLGRSGAGKSTRVANPLGQRWGAAVVDPDSLAGPGHEARSRLAKLVTRVKLVTGDNLVIPKIGDRPDSVVALARLLAGAGYRVELVALETPARVSRRRSYERSGETGRPVAPATEPRVDEIVARHPFDRVTRVG